MSIEQALRKLYDREINCSITSFWDGGFTVKIGDESNGFIANSGCEVEPEEIGETLMKLAREAYPDIDFCIEDAIEPTE